MRRPGEVRAALLKACHALARADEAPTLRELAHRAQVSVPAAEVAIKNMKRAGVLHIVRHRRVGYRNRPVAEYAPVVCDNALTGLQTLAQAITAWGRDA